MKHTIEEVNNEYLGLAHEAGWYVPKELVISYSLFVEALTQNTEETLERVRNKAITITARLDRDFFKGKFSSSGLECIEAIIKEELTPTQSNRGLKDKE